MRTRNVQLRCDCDVRVMQELRNNPNQSYQDIAIATNFSRSTVYAIIRRLTGEQRIRKVQGNGRSPNYYEFL